MNNLKLLFLIPLFLLASCTNLEDFQKMDPSDRARKACTNDDLVSHYQKLVRSHRYKIRDFESKLLNGYRQSSIIYKNLSKNKNKCAKKIAI